MCLLYQMVVAGRTYISWTECWFDLCDREWCSADSRLWYAAFPNIICVADACSSTVDDGCNIPSKEYVINQLISDVPGWSIPSVLLTAWSVLESVARTVVRVTQEDPWFVTTGMGLDTWLVLSVGALAVGVYFILVSILRSATMLTGLQPIWSNCVWCK